MVRAVPPAQLQRGDSGEPTNRVGHTNRIWEEAIGYTTGSQATRPEGVRGNISGETCAPAVGHNHHRGRVVTLWLCGRPGIPPHTLNITGEAGS